MMTKKLVAGLAGAIVLNLVHESFRKMDPEAPRMNEVGEEALNKSLSALSLPTAKDDEDLYLPTLAGDIVSNALYYATTATGAGGLSGLLAGLGAVYLPAKMGLNDQPVAGSDKKKFMTIGYYLLGGLVTTVIYKIINSKK